jgi:hypothetical protein
MHRESLYFQGFAKAGKNTRATRDKRKKVRRTRGLNALAAEKSNKRQAPGPQGR